MINIRPVNNSDLEILARIYTETYKDFDVGERWEDNTSLELLRYWLDRQGDLAFLAELDGEIVGGFFAAVKPWWDGMHLVDGELFVHPKHQKSGVGRELSKHMFKEAIKKYNAKVWDTYTFKKSEHPFSWYKKQGFDENKEWVMISGDLQEAIKRLDEK